MKILFLGILFLLFGCNNEKMSSNGVLTKQYCKCDINQSEDYIFSDRNHINIHTNLICDSTDDEGSVLYENSTTVYCEVGVNIDSIRRAEYINARSYYENNTNECKLYLKLFKNLL